MSPTHPDKLLDSKWSAVAPVAGERHFVVVALVRDEQRRVSHVVLEAVLSGRRTQIDRHALKDERVWQIGWV